MAGGGAIGPIERLNEEQALQKEAGEILDLALGRLSAGDRMVLELVYLEGHSVKEAAGLLGWSTVNVKCACSARAENSAGCHT